MDGFHFLRPVWLLAAPVGVLMAMALWRRRLAGDEWRDACDPELLKHLLVDRSASRRRWPLGLIALAWLVAVLAIAGPAWERLPQPVYRSADARVVVLDVSRSMNARDLKPSRLVRARFKVADILARTEDGLIGLVVFAGDAFVVAPLTDDANTLLNLLPALDPSVVPVQGSRASRGIDEAARLIEQGAGGSGEILIVTDGVDAGASMELVANLAAGGIRTSVLAVGTEDGAPIPAERGGFVKDRAGNIVLARTDTSTLQALATAGRGRFRTLSAGDDDIRQLLEPRGLDGPDQIVDDARVTERWRDAGPWLLLPLLPLAALAFRRGWLICAAAVALVPVPDAAAAGWESLWWRADQRAAQALERGDAELAARLAENPQLRGSAAYRARDYATAAGAFAEGDDAVALYNRGNALAHQRRLEEALAAYDAALDRDPAMEDAAHNRALVEQLLREQPRHEPSRGEHAREPGDPGGPENGRRPEEDEAPLTGADEDARERGAESGDQSEGGRADERPGGEEEPAGLDPGERLDAAGEGTQEAEGTAGEPGGGEAGDDEAASSERQQALEQWLRRIPDDPGGLLRRKFQRDYLERRRTAGVTTPAEGW